MKKIKNIPLMITLIIMILSGCKKLVEVDGPKTQINSSNIYKTDATAISVLTGIYMKMSSAYINAGDQLTSISYLTGLSSDELDLFSGSYDPRLQGYYYNALKSDVCGFEFWQQTYFTIYVVNSSLEGLSQSNGLSPAVKKQLLGEAMFMRAFCYFYLVNLYGDVPLALSTDYKINALMPRTSKEKVWEQIVADLKEAQQLLSERYLDGSLTTSSDERVRPTKSVATALLARAYLYQNEWALAEKEASSLISNGSFDLVSLDEVFKRNSKEAIWQLQPTGLTSPTNTLDGVGFIIESEGNNLENTPVYLSQTLLEAFEKADQRKIKWVNSVNRDGVTYSFAYKYKIGREVEAPVSEYATIFRLAEQYLIRAEARIQLGNIAQGVEDLNILRARATDKTPGAAQLVKLSNSLGQPAALRAVEHERQTELFTEWGHRWLDLKRTNRIDAIMAEVSPKKSVGSVWENYKQWYPINSIDLKSNPKLIQNSGY